MTLQALGAQPASSPPQQLVQMANDNGGRDNVSVILVRVLREYSRPTRRDGQSFRLVKITARRSAMAKLILSMDGLVLKEIPL